MTALDILKFVAVAILVLAFIALYIWNDCQERKMREHRYPKYPDYTGDPHL